MNNEIILNLSQNTFKEIIEESVQYYSDSNYNPTSIKCKNPKIGDYQRMFTLGNVTFIENLEEEEE